MDSYIRDHNITIVNTHVVESVDEFGNQFNHLSDGLKIFHMNIRSIDENLDETIVYLEQFAFKFEVIVLTETFKIHDTSLYSLPGYSLMYNEGTVNKNDGVVVYVKDAIEHTHLVVKLDNINLLQVSFKLNSKVFMISAVYRLNPTCPHTFNDNLHGYLKSIKGDVDYSVFIGDININILDQKDFTQDYLNILYEEGYISQINKYTRVQGERKSCIDHIFVKHKNSTLNDDLTPVIIQNPITDHYPIVLLINYSQGMYYKREGIQRVRFILNYNTLKQDLTQETWENIYKSDNVNDMANTFISVIQQKINRNTITQKFNKSEFPRKPWITKGVIKSISIKNSLYKKMLHNPINLQLKNQYNLYKNILSRLIKTCKINYYKKEINKNKYDTKHLYNCVNKICNPGKWSKTKSKIEKICLDDGEIIHDREEIVNCFNQHYAQLGANMASKINNSVNVVVDVPYVRDSMFLDPLVEPEIIKIISQLKNDTSPGWDGIKVNTIKEIKNEIVKPLTHIINAIMERGVWPSVFSVGIVTPVYKSGDTKKVINYRPITLISNIAKIAEKTLRSRFVKFLDKHDVLSHRQYGFREARSTQDAIAYVTNKIYKAMDDNKPSLCMFVDLAKAFDTVSHDLLLGKLQNYGFRGVVYDLVKSYLSTRVQSVQVDGIVSDRETVIYGVPQGTVLGPLFFILYLNDLLLMKSVGEIISYADDTAIIYRAETWEELKNTVQTDFSFIKQWFDENLLTLNYHKTTFLTFSPYYTAAFQTLLINDTHSEMEIHASESVKYLGITIDRHLRWNVHTDHTVKKLRSLLSRFRILRAYLTVPQLRILYFSLVESHLAYGIIGWGGAYKNSLKNLEVIQKWILKIIFNKPKTYPTELLYAEARVFDLRQLFAFCVLNGLRCSGENIDIVRHTYQTRQRGVLCKTHRCHKTIGQRSYWYIGQRLFNILPIHIRNVASPVAYKIRLKRWLLELPRRRLHELFER